MISVFFLAMVLILMITFILLRILAPTDNTSLTTRSLPPGKQQTRIANHLIRGTEDLKTAEALLLALHEPLRIPELSLLARDLDKTESETSIVAKQTVEIALVECFAAARAAEKAWIANANAYRGLDPVFRASEALAMQSLRRLNGSGRSRLERILKMVSDEDAAVSEEARAIEEDLRNGKRWLAFGTDQRPRLASLRRRREGLRRALEGLSRVQSRVEKGAIGDLERYLKRVQATREAVVGSVAVKGGQVRMLCKNVERAVDGYD